MSLVDIETAKQHLRTDGDEENDLIALYLSAAELSAVEFLNRNVYATQAALDAAEEPEEARPMVINDLIRSAILLILGHLYANREEVGSGTASKVPFGAHALLQPYRVGLGV